MSQSPMEYDGKWGRYRIRISNRNLTTSKELITKLLKMASGKDTED